MVPPRPLAGLPPADSRAVARAWLVRRIAASPIEAAAGLASASFAERGPGLCGSLLEALADDAALVALPAAGDMLRALVDATGSSPPALASDLAAAAEHLRRAALDVAMPATDPALHPALHDRLAHACASLLGGALAAPGASAGPEARARGDASAAPAAVSVRAARDAAPGARAASAAPEVPAADSAPEVPPAHDLLRVPPAVTVRDARARIDPRDRLTAEAARYVAAREPFALLAVEIEDAGVVSSAVLAAAEAALRAALPPAALHAPDGPGSMLVLTREADGSTLARALTRAVAVAGSHRGAPLRAAAGVAEHPRDADSPEELLAHADGQLFAARAEGLEVT